MFFLPKRTTPQKDLLHNLRHQRNQREKICQRKRQQNRFTISTKSFIKTSLLLRRSAQAETSYSTESLPYFTINF